MSKKVSQIQAEMTKLSQELERQKYLDTIAEIEAKLESISADRARREHEKKIRAYAEYEDAKRYVNSLRSELHASGTKATNEKNGKEIIAKIEGTSLKTFDPIHAGDTYDMAGATYFIKSVTFSYGGTTAEVVRCNTRAIIAEKTAKTTPYSSREVYYNHSNNQLTVPKSQAIRQNEIVTIGSKAFTPAFTLLGSPSDGTLTYELAPVMEG